MSYYLNEYIEVLKDNSINLECYQAPDDLDETFDKEKHRFQKEFLLEESCYKIDVLADEIDSGMWTPDDFSVFRINGKRFPAELESVLMASFDLFRNEFKKINYNENPAKHEFSEIIRNSKHELENLILLMQRQDIQESNLIALIKVKIDICTETQRFINYSQIPPTTQAKKVEFPQKPKKTIVSYTDLTQNQVVILMHYLKVSDLIGKKMPKNLMAASISELSGFSSEKLRQGFSHIESKSDSIDNLSFTEYDYSVVRRALEKVIAKIKEDSQGKFSTNI